MNKALVEKLAVQSLVWVDTGLADGREQVFSTTLFAELIVKECANFVENIFDDDGGHAPCEDYAKGIKQHFGVEE